MKIMVKDKKLSDKFCSEQELLLANNIFIDEINFIYKSWERNTTNAGYSLHHQFKFCYPLSVN